MTWGNVIYIWGLLNYLPLVQSWADSLTSELPTDGVVIAFFPTPPYFYQNDIWLISGMGKVIYENV